MANSTKSKVLYRQHAISYQVLSYNGSASADTTVTNHKTNLTPLKALSDVLSTAKHAILLVVSKAYSFDTN